MGQPFSQPMAFSRVGLGDMRDESALGASRLPPEAGLDFAELWREWRPRAAAYLRAFRALDAEEREDLASEAMLKAWEARGRYDPSRPFAPWFLTIVRRLAIDASARRRDRPVDPVSLEAEASRIAGAEELLAREAESDFTRRFIQGLEERDRELASLVYGQDLRVVAAARLVGMPAGSAKWRLFEIRKALRRAWEREYGETRPL
jgi:RNA polymerase sigma factor (sigma-70 family)